MLIFICVFIGKTHSQHIEGRIINAFTNIPVGNAQVLNQETAGEIFTTRQGYFKIEASSLPVKLFISAPGYDSRVIEIFTIEAELIIYIEPVMESLSEVVVRGTLVPAELREIPAAISVISQRELNRIDATNFAQAFNNVPGVYVNQGALNTTKLNIRGIGARSQYTTNRIQAYFNGIPLTTGEGELTLDDIDPDALSRVEIIKGPASSIYGSGLGGVINLYAAEATPGETKASVNTLIGSYNMKRKTISASHGEENTSVFVNYNHLETDGYRDNGNYDRKSMLANASLTTANGNSLNFLANFTRLKAFIPSSISEDDFRNNPQSAAFTWEQAQGYESYDRGLIGVSYTHKIASNFSNVTSLFLNFRDAFEPRPFDILKEERISAGARTKFNLDTSLFNLASQVSFGAEYFWEWYETGTFENLYRQFENQGSVLGLRLSNNEQDRNYANFFMQVGVEITEKLKIETGFNLNTTEYSLLDLFAQNEIDQSGDYRFETIFSPRIGASYEINPGKNLYTSISHGFSIPTVAETLTPDGQINTSLLPEKGFNYEIGFKGNWLANKLYTEVALYSIQINDLLVAQRVAEDQYVGINAGGTSHNGIELLVNYEISPFSGLRLRPYVNASFNFFEFREFNNRDMDFKGNLLPGVPKSTVNLGLDASFKNLTLYSNLLAVGEIPLNDQNSLFTESYKIVNLKVVYNWRIFQDLDVLFTGGLNNIFDEQYAASVLPNAIGFGNSAPRYYYPGNPRNYYAGLGLNYLF